MTYTRHIYVFVFEFEDAGTRETVTHQERVAKKSIDDIDSLAGREHVLVKETSSTTFKMTLKDEDSDEEMKREGDMSRS